jgi:hypothetical protein
VPGGWESEATATGALITPGHSQPDQTAPSVGQTGCVLKICQRPAERGPTRWSGASSFRDCGTRTRENGSSLTR